MLQNKTDLKVTKQYNSKKKRALPVCTSTVEIMSI